jgi:phosphosulfolactate synthase (CoM biosynthesis protein A)
LPNDPPAAEEVSGVTLKYFKDGMEVEEFVSREVVDHQMEECKYLGVVAVILELLIEKRSCGTVSPEEEERFKSVATALRSKVQP